MGGVLAGSVNRSVSVSQLKFERQNLSLSEQSRNCSGLVNAESRGLYLGFLRLNPWFSRVSC